MENLSVLQDHRTNLEQEKIKVKTDLDKMRDKLDELLKQKEVLDLNNEELKKQIAELHDNEDNSELEDSLEDGEEMRDLTEKLSLLTSLRRNLEERNSVLEGKCNDMQGQLQELLKGSQLEENSRLFYETLEGIRREKEGIIKEDQNIEKETKELWREAHEVKSEMEALSAINRTVDEDSREIQDIFGQIKSERGKLIGQDKLLNERYPLIFQSLDEVCQERIKLRARIQAAEEESREKRQLLQTDLEAALKQKSVEDLFDAWKAEKEKVLSDNKDLDKLMAGLMDKSDILNRKKRDLAVKNKELDDRSELLKERFSTNQSRKEKLVSDYKEKEDTLTNVTEEVEKFYEESGENKRTALNAILENFDQIKREKSLIMSEDAEVVEKIEQINSESEAIRDRKYHANKQTNYETKLKVLIEKKEAFLEQDKNIAEEFEKYEETIEKLQRLKTSLTKQIEDIDWQLCLSGNSLSKDK